MRALNWLALVVALVLVIIAVINRGILITPVELSFGVTRVSVPLWLVLLGFGAVLTAVFVAYLLKIQLSSLSATRKHAADLRQQRELAEAAELSRYTELRRYLEQEFEALGRAQRELEQRLRAEIADTTHSLEACIGEIHERLERQWPVPPEQQP